MYIRIMKGRRPRGFFRRLFALVRVSERAYKLGTIYASGDDRG